MATGRTIQRMRDAYDVVAKQYAETFLNEHEKKPKDQEILRRFSRQISGRKPVWDFGCGPGQTTKYLSDLGVDISGLDLSEAMVQQARAAHPEIRFRQGNVLELDFENDSIAGVVAFYAIVHFTKRQVSKTCREVFRVLQPGGVFLLTFHVGEKTIHVDEFLGQRINIDFVFFAPRFVASCLKNSGFESIEIIERDPYPGVEYASRRAYLFATKPVTAKNLVDQAG
jgi:ubiquinone/menaquinone biosynthesis C-methylase UbiE